MKAEAVPQFEIPDQSILVDRMTFNHLGQRHPARIEAVKRVEDEISVVARRPIEGDDRVQHGKIRSGDEDQLVLPLGPPDPGCSDSRSAGCGSLEQVAPSHDNFLLAHQPAVFFPRDPKRDPIDPKAAGTTRLPPDAHFVITEMTATCLATASRSRAEATVPGGDAGGRSRGRRSGFAGDRPLLSSRRVL